MRRSAPQPRYVCVSMKELGALSFAYLKEDTKRWEDDGKNDLANIAGRKCQFCSLSVVIRRGHERGRLPQRPWLTWLKVVGVKSYLAVNAIVKVVCLGVVWFEGVEVERLCWKMVQTCSGLLMREEESKGAMSFVFI